MGFYLGNDGDEVIPGLDYFAPGGSISSFNGFAGTDTVDFSGLTTGWLWFEPMLTLGETVQDTTSGTFFAAPEQRDLHIYATLLSIEHVIAGSGDDVFYMPDATIHIESGSGNDTFIYDDPENNLFPEGNIFAAGSGTDTLDLRADDWIYGYVVDLLDGTAEKFAWPGTTTIAISGFEIVHGSAGHDTLRPGWTTELLDGDAGNDTFDVNSHFLVANATYQGGSGTDTLDFSEEYGKFTADLTLGWFEQTDAPFSLYAYIFQIENVDAGHGDDTLVGASGRNVLRGGGGDDTISGRRGHDVLLGQAGADDLIGQAGSDKLRGGTGDDTLKGNGGHDKLFGQAGDDIGLGGGGRDVLLGNNGSDRLKGGGASDLIAGGTGDDKLWGQRGADTFQFDDGHGNDVIRDFDAKKNGEKIDLSRLSTLDNFTEVIAASKAVGNGVLIDTGKGSSIFLLHVALGDLDPVDFLFA